MDNNSIIIIDYGLGNVRAFFNIFNQLGLPAKIVHKVEDLNDPFKIILPGVGSFDWAMNKLNSSGFRDKLDHFVLNDKVPVLGVCSGMQIMAKKSEEGESKGLGWIDAKVVKIYQSSGSSLPLPHMGWNKIKIINNNPLFTNINDPYYYFLHSYYVKLKNSSDIIANATYCDDFTVAFAKNSIFGTQFHPEKSHESGIQLLKNFASI